MVAPISLIPLHGVLAVKEAGLLATLSATDQVQVPGSTGTSRFQ